MKKIVTASRAKAVLKWIFSVSFVIGVSIFVNDAFIRDVTAPARGTDVAGERDGPAEAYYENGQLAERGTYNMGEPCGEWIEDGVTVTDDPCPPDLEDGN